MATTTTTHPNLQQHIHKAFDRQSATKHRAVVFSTVSTDMDKSRLHVASSPHSGDWLRLPLSAVLLSDEAGHREWIAAPRRV